MSGIDPNFPFSFSQPSALPTFNTPRPSAVFPSHSVASWAPLIVPLAIFASASETFAPAAVFSAAPTSAPPFAFATFPSPIQMKRSVPAPAKPFSMAMLPLISSRGTRFPASSLTGSPFSSSFHQIFVGSPFSSTV